MALEFNGTNIDTVTFNGTTVKKVFMNGTMVWYGSQDFVITIGTAPQSGKTMYGFNPLDGGAGAIDELDVIIDGTTYTWDVVSTLLSNDTNNGMVFTINGEVTVANLTGVTAEITGTIITLTDGVVIYNAGNDYTQVIMSDTLTNVTAFSNKIEAAYPGNITFTIHG